MAAGPPPAPQEAQAAAPALGPQAAVDQPHDQGPPLGPSPRGPLFAPVRDATAIAEGIRRLPDPPSAGGGALGHSPAPPLPQLPLHCPQALPVGAAPAQAAPYHQMPLLALLPGGAPASPPVFPPPPAGPPHIRVVPLRGSRRGPPYHAAGGRSVLADSTRPPVHRERRAVPPHGRLLLRPWHPVGPPRRSNG